MYAKAKLLPWLFTYPSADSAQQCCTATSWEDKIYHSVSSPHILIISYILILSYPLLFV